MLSIDLFDSKYEKQLHEGAVDQLEQHRIDVLNDRMQELLARAKESRYKNDPAALVSLKQQYEKIKSERDSYYRVREDSHMYQGPHGRQDVERKNGVTRVSRRDWDQSRSTTTDNPGGKYFANKDMRGQGTGSAVKSGSGVSSTQGSMRKYPRLDYDGNNAPNYEVDETGIPGNIPKEKIPGKEELLKGRGRTYYEGQKKNSDSPLDQRLQRLKVQARREFPRAHNDEEALLLKLLDKETRDAETNRRVDARQDAEIQRNFDFDSKQENEIEDLQAQVGVKEHGGGIGPRQHWQDLMKNEGWSDKHNPTPYAVYIDGRQWKVFSSDEHARAVAEKVRDNLKLQGRDQTVTIAPSEDYLQGKIKEEKQISSKEDFVRERDRLLRMITQETNPANKQILRSAIRQLESRAENEGWLTIQQRMVREDNASEAAEQAILKRIMVAHTDLLKQFGPEKVMQAAEEVAYNVGDLGEIGSSDVSGWVNQVKQILGATA